MTKIYDLIIVGGGIAGITAAIYAARKEMSFAIIAPEFGGEIMNTTYVENYPGFKSISGRDLAEKYVEHMKVFNPEIIEDAVTEVTRDETNNTFIIKTYGAEFITKTMIWATGSKYKELGALGEVEMLGRGVTYCSTCDGPLFKDKIVAVVGSGNTALTSAIYMKAIAKKVYLLVRSEKIRGDPILVEKLSNDSKVEILYSTQIKKIVGEKKVTSILVNSANVEKEIILDGVIINVGYNPITEPIKSIVTLNEFGYLDVDKTNMSSTQGFFAAGDVVFNAYKQLVISASDGATAALGAYDYLSSQK